MDPITIGLLAAGGLLVYRGFTSGTVKTPPPASLPPGTFTPGGVPQPSGTVYSLPPVNELPIPPLGGSGGLGPGAPPVAGKVPWPPGPGQPGYVTIGGAPVPQGYNLGNMQTAIQASGITATLAGATTGVVSAIGGSAGAASVVGTTAATAIPLIGIGVAIIGTVLGIIAKHHAQAVALEASTLNQAVPVIKQRMVLILQAAIRGEVNQEGADALLKQAVSDYYSMVSKIIQGRWPYVLKPGQVMDNTVNTFLTGGPKPSTCNGPCEVGHDTIEPNAIQVSQTVKKVLLGYHGVMTLQVVASHAGFAGMPRIQVIY